MTHKNFLLVATIFMAITNIKAQFTAPVVNITRDDHVATIEMDYNESAGWGGQLWSVGAIGLDPSGYRVQWWIDDSDTANVVSTLGCSTSNSTGTSVKATSTNPHQLVTANVVVQIQPLANDVTYHLKVEKLNSLGQICSPATELIFEGGDGTRVDLLRSTMTFFDDFNLPLGPPDELKWNNAMGPQTDPRFNLFFVNPQCHTHTLNGTLNNAAGDRSQVAQRARKSILIEEDTRRKIVFDMDGIFSGRSIWYLDLNPVITDLTGHLSFFDEDGDTGLPADILRLRANGNDISVNLINSAGASFRVASAHLPDFGRRMSTNVRRSFDVRVGIDGIQIFVDGTEVINASFDTGIFKPGVYNLLWSTVGYNTSKSDNPFFLSHWDNFGFDGPDVDPYIVHNYVTRIEGTDLQKANAQSTSTPIFTVNVPDDIRPTSPNNITNEVWLVFSYQKNDYSSFNIEPGDSLLFNGNKFLLPDGANNTSPLIPEMVDHGGSPISNRIKIGEVQQGGALPLIIGDNTIQFFASNTGIMNVHIEVLCPNTVAPPVYTPPSDIHHFVYPSELPKLGPPARIVFIDSAEWSFEGDFNLVGPTVSDSIPVEILVGNGNWANWAPHWLNMPATTAEYWSKGGGPGIDSIQLFLSKKGEGLTGAKQVAILHTNHDAPAAQVRYEFKIDTKKFPNGEYELFVQATNAQGLKSHPQYRGIGFLFEAQNWSGAYYPVNITISNTGTYIFKGTNGPIWTTNNSWENGAMPPNAFEGPITIDADCEVPIGYDLQLMPGSILQINSGNTITVKK